MDDGIASLEIIQKLVQNSCLGKRHPVGMPSDSKTNTDGGNEG